MNTTDTPLLRILLVDDSPTFLDAAVHALAADPRIEIVGKAFSGQEGVDLVARAKPDLVLMDVAMPRMNGFEATRLIKAQPDAPQIVILTSYDLPQYRTAAQTAGADSFISKADFGTLVPPLIDTVLAERDSAPS
jgi:DNA-binding NarL/FixJ family response regulator